MPARFRPKRFAMTCYESLWIGMDRFGSPRITTNRYVLRAFSNWNRANTIEQNQFRCTTKADNVEELQGKLHGDLQDETTSKLDVEPPGQRTWQSGRSSDSFQWLSLLALSILSLSLPLHIVALCFLPSSSRFLSLPVVWVCHSPTLPPKQCSI